MPAKKSSSPPKPETPLRRSDAVEQFLVDLKHPLAAEVRALRSLILSADARLLEGIKWNAPSFHHHDWFATFHLRSASEVVLILHRGAKVKTPLKTTFIDDASGLLTWLANDRAKVTFKNAAEIQTHRTVFATLLQRWLHQMDTEAGPA